jgi:hypothetical protein
MNPRASVNEGNLLTGCGSVVLSSTALFRVSNGKGRGENGRSFIMSNFVICSCDVMLLG